MREFADCLGYKNTGTISQFENNKNVPSFHSLIRIAAFFGVTIDWLVGHTETLYFNDSITWTEKHLHIPHENISPSTSQDLLWNLYLHEHYPEYIQNTLIHKNASSIIHCRYGRILRF